MVLYWHETCDYMCRKVIPFEVTISKRENIEDRAMHKTIYSSATLECAKFCPTHDISMSLLR